MRRAMYQPLGFFWFWQPEPVEVELLEWIEPPTPLHIRLARIRMPVPKEALINIIAKIPEAERKVTYMIREVPAQYVTVIEAES
jgi:hypothetical protein